MGNNNKTPNDPQRKEILETAANLAESGLKWEIRLPEGKSMMPPGRNGPYFDLESPLRNTAHWLVTFSIAYKITGEPRFFETATRLASFLTGDHPFQIDGVPVHRQKGKKDWCNGVIGQAWLAEGLHRAGLYLENEAAAKKAQELVQALPFDAGTGVWLRLDPGGRKPSIDWTYNHQSWFASIEAEIMHGSKPKAKIFLDKSLEKLFGVDNNGLIRHVIETGNAASKLRSLYRKAKVTIKGPANPKGKAWETYRTTGYHMYVLFSLARLFHIFPDHPFFASQAFRRSLQFATQEEFLGALLDNHFAFPYNAPGFEYLLIALSFRQVEPKVSLETWRRLFEEQKRRTFCKETGLFASGIEDGTTLAARLHEFMLGAEMLLVE